jgi:hypothetical protein
VLLLLSVKKRVKLLHVLLLQVEDACVLPVFMTRFFLGFFLKSVRQNAIKILKEGGCRQVSSVSRLSCFFVSPFSFFYWIVTSL